MKSWIQRRAIGLGVTALTAGLPVGVLAQDKPAPVPAPAVQPDGKDAKEVKDAPATTAPSLAVGDKAPALTIEKWVKGEPISGFEKGRVYVVEFWATWCGPCKQSIPHLTEMQKKFKDKGVTFIGVSSSEHSGLKDVEPFVEKMGDKMAYTVAWDKEGATNKAWMEASEQGGIPTAFVVTQEGKLAWIGHPMAGLEKVVERVTAGKFDLDKYKTNAKMAKEFEEAAQGGDFKKALEVCDKILAADPDLFGEFALTKFGLLLMAQKDFKAAYAFAAEGYDKFWKDDAETLGMLAMGISMSPQITEKNYDLAIKFGARAVELTKEKDMPALDALGCAYFAKGDIDKAIETQTKAVAAAKDDEKKQAEANLAKYKAAKDKPKDDVKDDKKEEKKDK